MLVLDKIMHFLAYGLFPFSFWGYLAILLVLTHITMVSVTIYLHRHQAHRALNLHPILSHFFRAWLWLTTGMNTKQWVAVHRKHHAKAETKEDPHSPQVFGIKKLIWHGADLYRDACKNKADMDRYSVGVPNDWMEKNVYSKHTSKGYLIMLLLNFILLGLPGVLIWALQMAWTPFFAAGIINGVGHYWGYRNFECSDAARNISPWGILIAGEELHNNHHTFGTSAKLSVKWWEFDIGWMYIKLFSWLGLAKVKHLPPELIEASKSNVDLDTVKALIMNRFRVLKNYQEEVLMPVFQEEKSKLKNSSLTSLFRRAKKPLIREESIIKPKSKQYLNKLLEVNKSIQTVYEYRNRLQAIWHREIKSQKERVEKLQEWCKQAEETGITVLQDFAKKIKGYSLPA